MAVEGFTTIDDTSTTSVALTDILPTSITVPGPVGTAVELQIQVFQATSTIFSVNVNGTVLPINNAAVIQGGFNFTLMIPAGDTLNFQTTLASVIRIITAVGGTP